MEYQSEYLTYFLDYGSVGVMFVLLLVYTYYSERKRQKNISEMVKQTNTSNANNIEELKTAINEYIDYLKLELDIYRSFAMTCAEKNTET